MPWSGRAFSEYKSLFPAMTYALIVGVCDGFFEVATAAHVRERRFFDLVTKLPMDLQALVSLRMWAKTATVIGAMDFGVAFSIVIV
jgi:hypothetical protein